MTARSKPNPSKAAARRREPVPLPGYPQERPFRTLQDVKAYLDAPKITCLLCGREYHSLGVHLDSHGLSMDEYKIRFGIPFTYGLAGKTFRMKSSRRMRRMRKQGLITARPSPQAIRKLVRASKNRRRAPDSVQHHNVEKVLRLHRKDKTWQPSDFDEFFRRIKSGRTVLEVESDPDMPTRKAFHVHLKRNPSLRRRYERVWEALPFAVQVRANKTGTRYRRTLVKLRLSGKTWNEVAERMQVKPSTVRSMWHSLKRSGRLKKYS